jgi:hypothetical protein
VRGCEASENEMGGAKVQGLPLSSLTVAYFYVEYGTNLAFLSRPNENYCAEAVAVLEEVREYRPDDVTLIGIIDDSEGICRRLNGGGTPAATPVPASSPSPTPGM